MIEDWKNSLFAGHSLRKVINKLGRSNYLGKKFAGGAGKRWVDLQTLNKGGRSHKLHLWHFGLESVPAILVEEDFSVNLFPHLSLIPLLLLGLTTGQGSLHLLLLGLLLNFWPLCVKKSSVFIVIVCFGFSDRNPWGSYRSVSTESDEVTAYHVVASSWEENCFLRETRPSFKMRDLVNLRCKSEISLSAIFILISHRNISCGCAVSFFTGKK